MTDWANTKYLFVGNGGFLDSINTNDKVAFDVMQNCQKQLGVDVQSGKILFKTNDAHFVKKALSTSSKDNEINFYGLHGKNLDIVTIYKSLFQKFSNIQIINNDDDDGSIVPSSMSFDGIIIQGVIHTKRTNYGPVMDALTNNGCAIILNYNNKYCLDEELLKYEIPLMLDHYDSNALLLKKTQEGCSKVRYGYYIACDGSSEESYWIERLTEWIKNGITTDWYQELDKEDFVHTRKIKFDDVKRLPDQLNFVWKAKDSIITIDEDAEELLYNADISDEQIVDSKKLSSDPFKITANSMVYLHNFNNEVWDEPLPCRFGNEYKSISNSYFPSCYNHSQTKNAWNNSV